MTSPAPWRSLQTHVPPDRLPHPEDEPGGAAEGGGGGGNQQQQPLRRAVIWAPSFQELQAMIARAAEEDEEEEDYEEGGNGNGNGDGIGGQHSDTHYHARREASALRRQARAALADLAGATEVQAAGLFPPGTGMVSVATHGAGAIAAAARSLAEAAAATTHHDHRDPPTHLLRRGPPPFPLRVVLGDNTFVFSPKDLVEASALMRPGQSLARALGGFLTAAGLPLSGLEKATLGLLMAPGAPPHAASAHPPHRGIFPASIKRLCMVPYAQMPPPSLEGDEADEEAGEEAGAKTAAADDQREEPLFVATRAACRDMATYLRAVGCCRDLRVLEVAADMDTPSGAARLVSPSCRPSFLPAAALAFSRLRELRVVARFEASPAAAAAAASPFFDLSAFSSLDSALLHNLALAPPSATPVPAPRRSGATSSSSSSAGAAAAPPPPPPLLFASPPPPPPPPAAFDLELGLPARRLRSLRLCGFVVVGRRRLGVSGGAPEGKEGGAPPLPEELRLEACTLRARSEPHARRPQVPEVALLSAVGWTGRREEAEAAAVAAVAAEDGGGAMSTAALTTTKLSIVRCCCCCSVGEPRPQDDAAWAWWLLRAFLGEPEGEGADDGEGGVGDEEEGGDDGLTAEEEEEEAPPPLAARVCPPALREPALVLAAWDAAWSSGMVERGEGGETTTAPATAAAAAAAAEEEDEDDEAATTALAAGVAALTVHDA